MTLLKPLNYFLFLLIHSYALLRSFAISRVPLLTVPDQFCKGRIRTSDVEHRYALYMESKVPDIQSAFNQAHGQKRFFSSTPDLYSPGLKKAYKLFGCRFHGHFLTVINPNDGSKLLKPCPYLPLGTTLDSKSIYGDTYRQIQQREQRSRQRILTEFASEVESIEIVYQCDFEAQMADPTSDVYQFFNGRLQGTDLAPPLRLRDALKGRIDIVPWWHQKLDG